MGCRDSTAGQVLVALDEGAARWRAGGAHHRPGEEHDAPQAQSRSCPRCTPRSATEDGLREQHHGRPRPQFAFAAMATAAIARKEDASAAGRQ
jgi:hypothetical protein